MPSNFIAKGADGYEAIMGRWSRRLAGPFLDFSGVPSRGRVLDAGCGTGSLTLALATHPDLAAIEALDFEENFVTALRGRTTDPRITAQQGDVCVLPYADEEFDGVYSLLVLHFVSDPHRAVREQGIGGGCGDRCSRCLKPIGRKNAPCHTPKEASRRIQGPGLVHQLA